MIVIKSKPCAECGSTINKSKRTQSLFCKSACKRKFNNRRASRGAVFYDLFMELRHNRKDATEYRVWSQLTRLASSYKEEDMRHRDGRPSWMPARLVLPRFGYLSARFIGWATRPPGGK